MSHSQPIDTPNSSPKGASDAVDDGMAGLVIAIGGVGSLDWCGLALRRLLRHRRPPYAIWIIPWGLGFGRWHADLTNVANRDAHARALAERIRIHKQTHPEHPVFVVTKSGGAGVAVKTFELLDDGAIERAVLLAPALSPSYNLAAALRAVRREIVVFWSPLDLIVLGAGTRVFGTIDRERTVGAGLVGFRVPPRNSPGSAQCAQYDKLRQVRWRPQMAAWGNFGGHMGPDSPFFLKKYVVPLLAVEEPPAR
jgi:hypothetical protein